MKSGSISKTANALGRTQPAISLAIKNLEESIGFRLFKREGRQLTAVPEAFYLLEEATGILDRISMVSRTMNSLQNAQAGSLNVAAMPGPAAFLFPRFVSRAIGKNPNIRISLSSRSSAYVYELAATQSIDFGFVDVIGVNREASQYHEEIITADCYCALPKAHPLISQAAISVKQLHQIPMGGVQTNHLINQRIMKAFEDKTATFNKVVDSQTYWPLLQFVSTGQCLAIVDPLTVVTEKKSKVHGSAVVFRPIAEELRYDYAVLSSNFRPMSQLAAKIKAGWINEVMQVLKEIHANPQDATNSIEPK